MEEEIRDLNALVVQMFRDHRKEVTELKKEVEYYKRELSNMRDFGYIHGSDWIPKVEPIKDGYAITSGTGGTIITTNPPKYIPNVVTLPQ